MMTRCLSYHTLLIRQYLILFQSIISCSYVRTRGICENLITLISFLISIKLRAGCAVLRYTMNDNSVRLTPLLSSISSLPQVSFVKLANDLRCLRGKANKVKTL